MITRTSLSTGWTLRIASDAVASGVPEHVLAALPVPATVPGTVHTDLLAAGLVPDPYVDRNEITLDWIGRTDWCYERSIDLSAAPEEELVIAFDGLDTVATVTVDGEVIARSENMHRRVEVSVPVGLRREDAVLAVRFDSAWRFGEAERDRVGALPNAYPAPFNYLRKAASNFGWDWGPTLVTAGIWRDARLVRGTAPAIRRVSPTVLVEGPVGIASLAVELDRPAPVPLRLRAELAGTHVAVDLEPGARTATVRLEVQDPELWWPHGLGAQRLYDVVVRLDESGHDGGPDGGTPVDEWTGRVGFRSLRLDTTPDADGTPFVVVVNGATVPIRGANWIPDDCFLPRVTEERLRVRIGQAVDANTNLLRVWGGGVYESEAFYRVCDELGVLVWQDFLFACAAYPEDERLAAEIEAEARDNVERLMPHPSLVLWNGNNENIWGWFDWHWQEALDGREWGLGYYLKLLPEVVADVDPSRPYWAGSPYSGSMELHPNDDDHGLTHVWDVWNQVDYTVYAHHRPRFVSEFGWQAPPAWSTITRSVRDAPLTPTSPGMLHHQKAEDGNGKLERGLVPHFAVPESMTDWHFAMQLNQARAIAFGIEHFRSLRPRNFGTIVWQLNDCWPVTSWAAIDGDGRKKPLWYALRSSQATRLLTIQPTDGPGGAAAAGTDGPRGLALVGVNDGGEAWREYVTVRRLRFDGTVLAELTTRIVTDRFGSARVELPDALARPDEPGAELLVAETSTGVRTERFFREDRDLAYSPARFTTTVERVSDDTVLVTVTATTLLRDLVLLPDRLSPSAEVDDALVTLLPGQAHTFTVRGLPPGQDSDLVERPVLRTANDLVVPSRDR
ncbi:glycoside hydrolase family 2 protein [Promicromonospora vindobonensis]|uniref:beta-mannosidase n=1 Tax=Promicromonospora vindobonensis TaxID=195748 RepID=A0ABW5VUQ2_9MICO